MILVCRIVCIALVGLLLFPCFHPEQLRAQPFSMEAERRVISQLQTPEPGEIQQRLKVPFGTWKKSDKRMASAGLFSEEGEHKGLFFPADREKSGIHNFDGSRYPDSNDNDLTLAFCDALGQSCAPLDNIPQVHNVEAAAQSWYIRNQSVNYIPLKAYFLKYRAGSGSVASKDSAFEFCSVIPHKEGSSSQLITFGFEPEFFLTNTSASVVRIELIVGGVTHYLFPKRTVLIGFSRGQHAINCNLVLSSGKTFRSGFRFSNEPVSGESWSNSIMSETGELDFIY